MPERKTIERARRAKAEGKSPSTQAGEFVREEMHHIREGKHGARSPEQAIAIGLSKARRAGVKLPPPEKGKASEATRKSAKRALASAPDTDVSPKRSRTVHEVLEHEGRAAASHKELSEHARKAARKRRPEQRSAAARKAAKTKGPKQREEAARKAARTRARREAAQ